MQETIICKDIFDNKYERNVEDLIQRNGVYAVIIEDNKILLTKQWDGYSLAGGGVEKGETLEQALVREVKEETGLGIEAGKLFHQTCTFFQRDKDSAPYQAFMFYFSPTSVSGDITNDSITESEKSYTHGTAEWVDLKDIQNIVFRHSVSLDEILNAYK
jgi:8-oxo-dGTP diphosphatase